MLVTAFKARDCSVSSRDIPTTFMQLMAFLFLPPHEQEKTRLETVCLMFYLDMN